MRFNMTITQRITVRIHDRILDTGIWKADFARVG